MRLPIFGVLLLLSLGTFLRADESSGQLGLTITAKIGGLEIQESNLIFTEKPDHIHVIVDAFPYRDAIKALGKAFSWLEFSKALAKDTLLRRYPKAQRAAIDVVEYPERDDYGAPRWDSVVRLGSFDAKRSGDKVSVRPRAQAGP
jgi:hypothetical protein